VLGHSLESAPDVWGVDPHKCLSAGPGEALAGRKRPSNQSFAQWHSGCSSWLLAGVSGPRNNKERVMSNASKRGEGAAEELGGKIKGTIGKVVGSEKLETEGKARELEGKAKQDSAKAGERTKGKVEEAVGKVKNRVGAAIDNEQMQAEGKVKELKGEARQRSNH
jgi:uncharacterized protein YjbJ (UPF0337 family)